MDEEEKSTTWEKTDVGTDNDQQEEDEYDRKSMWDSSVMRRAIQVQTIQASAIKINKDIFQSVHLFNTSVKKC